MGVDLDPEAVGDPAHRTDRADRGRRDAVIAARHHLACIQTQVTHRGSDILTVRSGPSHRVSRLAQAHSSQLQTASPARTTALRTRVAFADSDDFDALRLWAVGHNAWKDKRSAALIVSDDGRFWKVFRDGSTQQVDNRRGQVKRAGQPAETRPGHKSRSWRTGTVLALIPHPIR